MEHDTADLAGRPSHSELLADPSVAGTRCRGGPSSGRHLILFDPFPARREGRMAAINHGVIHSDPVCSAKRDAWATGFSAVVPARSARENVSPRPSRNPSPEPKTVPSAGDRRRSIHACHTEIPQLDRSPRDLYLALASPFRAICSPIFHPTTAREGRYVSYDQAIFAEPA